MNGTNRWVLRRNTRRSADEKLWVAGSIPTAPTNLLHFTAFVFGFDTKSRLTPIELIHCKLFNPRRTIFNRTALLVTDHVCIDSQRNPWVTVP
jgi:hypothetical protein